MAIIRNIHARQILDSRGTPTVEAIVTLDNDKTAMASVPSGASTGSKEAIEKRDNKPNCYHGLSVYDAVNNINTKIKEQLVGLSVLEQSNIDHAMLALDATDNKARLGANAILAVSIACKKASAIAQNIPLFQAINDVEQYQMPVPMMNVINGGAHANNKIDFQEFMLVPHGASSFAEAMQFGAEVFYCLRQHLSDQGLTTAVGDEGGFAPDLQSTEHALDVIIKAIELAGFVPGTDISIALDVAASEFHSNNQYNLAGENLQLTNLQLIDYLKKLVNSYPIISIEDGLSEDDWDGWKALTTTLGVNCQIVGDDLFVTNTKYLQQGIDNKIANAILIKPNQIGSLTETLATIQLAKQFNYRSVISHRSGETEDTFIADLAVAMSTGQIKTGSLSRTDRIAKYNQLLRIEEEYSDLVSYPGITAFALNKS